MNSVYFGVRQLVPLVVKPATQNQVIMRVRYALPPTNLDVLKILILIGFLVLLQFSRHKIIVSFDIEIFCII